MHRMWKYHHLKATTTTRHSPHVSSTWILISGTFRVSRPGWACTALQDKASGNGAGFGFVSFATPEDAASALKNLNGRSVNGCNLRVNFAFQGGAAREDTSHHFHVFIGMCRLWYGSPLVSTVKCWQHSTWAVGLDEASHASPALCAGDLGQEISDGMLYSAACRIGDCS